MRPAKLGHGNGNTVTALALTPDGDTVAVAHSKFIDFLDINTGEMLKKIGPMSGRILSMDLSADGRLLLCGSDDGAVAVFDALSGDRLRTMSHDGPVTSVAWTPDARRAITASDDGIVRIWDFSLIVTYYPFKGTGRRVEHDPQGLARSA